MRYFLCLPILLVNWNLAVCQSTSRHSARIKINWSKPAYLIKNNKRRVKLFSSNATENQQGIFVFGNTVFDSKNPNKLSRWISQDKEGPLLAIGPDGQRIKVPKGSYRFAFPRAVADSAGTIHLLWAKPDTPFAQKPNSHFTTIYYDRYSNHTWSKPRIIYHAKELSWQPDLTSDLIVDKKGVFHMLFSTLKTDTSAKGVKHLYKGVMHLYKDKHGWHEAFWHQITNGYCGGYIDLAVRNSKQLFLSCVGPDYNTPGDENSVFFSSSNDNGKHWKKLKLISLSGPELKRATNTNISTTPDGTIHIVWAKSTDRGIMPETIWHAYSQDGGESWSDPEDLKIKTNGHIIRINMVSDTSGHLYLVFTTAENLKKYLTHYKIWTDNHWTKDTILFKNDNFKLSGDLLLTKKGDLYMVLNRFGGSVSIGSVEAAMPQNTFYSIGHIVK